MDGIEYRDLYDYAGVFAGSNGKVYRVTNSVIEKGTRFVDLAEMKTYPCGSYETVRVMRKNGTMVTANVHALICEAFHGKPPRPGLHVRHLNGNSRDNRAANLAYGTPRENWRDKMLTHTATIGEKNGNAKLTDAERLEVVSMYFDKGETQKQIADHFGVTQGAVSKIIKQRGECSSSD